MSQINLAPYIARALACNSDARRLIDQLYAARAVECLAASRKNSSRNHPHVTGGRAEQQFYARCALAVLDVYGQEEITLRRIYRTADRKLYDLLSQSGRVVSTPEVSHLLEDRSDDDFMDAVVLLFAMLSTMGKKLDASDFADALSDFVKKATPTRSPDPRRKSAAAHAAFSARTALTA